MTAQELEMDLEKYEKERRAARRKRRTQSTYLPVPEHEEQNKAAATSRPGKSRRWSDFHRLAGQLDKMSDSLDLGKYGKLGV